MTPRTLLFLHGSGDDDEARRWLASLDGGFRREGLKTLEERGYTVVAPSYLHLLKADSVPADMSRKHNHRSPADLSNATGAAGAHRLGLAALERHLEPVPSVAPVAVPAFVVDLIARTLLSRVAHQTHRFRKSAALREAVYQRILEELPTEGTVSVVAYSLGAIVAADLLHHLPPRVTVDIVVTLGSPLGLRPFRKHLRELRHEFPYASVGPWLNVVAHKDIAIGFRGVGARFPEALDIFVDNGPTTKAHDATRYLGQEAVIRALAWVGEQATPLGLASSAPLGHSIPVEPPPPPEKAHFGEGA